MPEQGTVDGVFVSELKGRTGATLAAEPLAKRPRTDSNAKKDIVDLQMEDSSSTAVRWSWPRRLDEIASLHGEVLGASDSSGGVLTWAELAVRSRQVGQALEKRGLRASPVSAYPQHSGHAVVAPMPIVVMMGHTVDMLSVIFGVLRQGFPLLPLSILHENRAQLEDRYQEVMELFEPAAVITDSPLVELLLQHRPNLRIISPSELLAGQEVSHNYHDVITTTDNVLAYMFTSGSTGKSKCVTATNRMAHAEVVSYPEVFRKLGVTIDPTKDRWRQDHEPGWWGAAFFGEVDVALAMMMGMVMMKPTDPAIASRGVSVMGALPSGLQNLYPGAQNIPETLRVIFSWAERCEVELGRQWKSKGVKMADLLIATEYFLTFASCNLEVARGGDGRLAHATRTVGHASAYLLNDNFEPIHEDAGHEVTGLIAIAGPQVSPGYVEMGDDGTPAIGAGPLSRDTFKTVNGQWCVVPKDIMRRTTSGSYVSIGRAGGMIKVKGGVLMATNVVELQLQTGSIAAACITDPLHVQGGGSLVLEINWEDVWSFRNSLQRSSFLRLPVLYTCTMPRNESTGKVQKALVQKMAIADYEAEIAATEELRNTQKNHLDWYQSIARRPAMALCLAQPWAYLAVLRAAWHFDAARMILSLLSLLPRVLLLLAMVAWSHAATAHAAKLRSCDMALAVAVLSAAGHALGSAFASLFSCALLSAIVCYAMLETASKRLESDKEGGQPNLLMRVFRGTGRLRFAMVVGAVANLYPAEAMRIHYSIGLLCIFACGRRLPPAPWDSGALQRVAATAWSFGESLGYMLCFPVMFALALPSLVIAAFQRFAWSQLKQPGQPIARKQAGWAYKGPGAQLRLISNGTNNNGSIWLDLRPTEATQQAEDASGPARPAAQATTAVGARGQELARKAGVDFRSVDSLRIARLSVLLKKHLRAKQDEAALEFRELREACVDEATFVALIEARFEAPVEEAAAGAAASSRGWVDNFMAWAQGGAFIHREGATNAPWDCQVDVLMKWEGEDPLDHQILTAALEKVVQQHPLLRARFPPDDATDEAIGSNGSGLSTTSAATWSLINELFQEPSVLGDWLRRLVAYALWRCWPRTVVLHSDERLQIDIPVFSKQSDGNTGTLAEEAHSVLGEAWNSWWKPSSMFNVCAVNLESDGRLHQFLYCSTSHKYSDGGSAAAFVHSLREAYDSLLAGQAPAHGESQVLAVQQQRLMRYLQGEPSPEGQVDMYLFDINNDTFSYEFGHSVGVQFTEQICQAVRVAGLRMACSEEIAWLACITCALCRLLPDEKLIKILMVHNGRQGDAEGSVACVSSYVMLTIPCVAPRSETPLADIASRVIYAVTSGKFRRPAPCEQAHARINIGGMIGTDGNFSQVFKQHRTRGSSWSRAPYVVQLRMDNEGGIWCAKDFKCHQQLDACDFWTATICAAQEIAEGWFVHALSPY
eukprot:gb/GFBE01036433.1/.p1 GENE.gb/GFBE01036433.1/~~gb/GFBE01036433.1/.p1  ORF type:complete len:1446 (+),score=313.09 gb/GFBE01036433.1/:1-4338(+)